MKGRIYDNDTGDIAIGSTNPLVTLDVAGKILARTNAADAVRTRFITGKDTVNHTANGELYVNYGNGFPVYVGSGGTLTDFIVQYGDMNVNSGQLFVDQSEARVGVGTDDPKTRLHVQGPGSSTAMLRLSTVGTGDRDFEFSISGASADYDTLFFRGETGHDAGSFSNLMAIRADGRVGVGTDDPSAPLHISGYTSTLAGWGRTLQLDAYAPNILLHETQANNYFRFGLLNGTRKLYLTTFDANGGNITNHMVVDGNLGRVGIGTTSPGSTLHVRNRWGSQGTPMVNIDNTGDGDTLYVKHNAQRADMYVANFLNSAGSVLAVKGNGSVGVGTASPDSKFKLDVNGTAAVRGELYCANRVGIGTFNPKFKLELVGDHDLMKLQASSASAYYEGLVFYNNKNERHAGIRAHTPYSQGSITGDLEIWTETAGADIVLAPVGGVGIGTDNPEHKLDVNGSAVVRGPLYLATPGDYRVQSLVVGDDSPPMLVFDSITNDHRTVLVPAEKGLWISDQYNSRVNVELTDAGNFWVRGTVTAQGGFSGSDRRMKFDAKPVEYGITDIMALEPKEYFQSHVDKDMVTGEISFDEDNGANSIGFIAQEVVEIIPEAVRIPEDDTKEIWSMDYDKIVTVLVKAVQEQQQEIESLKQRIEVLEGNQ